MSIFFHIKKRCARTAFFAVLYRSEETENAKDNAYKIVDADKASEDAEDNTDNGKSCENTDKPSNHGNNNEKDNKLNEERNEIAFFNLKGGRPKLFTKSMSKLLSINL